MKTLRTVVVLTTLLLLTIGYGVSQFAYLQGWAPDYAHKVDTPLVTYAALLLFLAIVVLAFIPDRSSDEDAPGDDIPEDGS